MASRSEASLRPARPGDAAAVTRVVRDAYAPLVPVIGREPGPMGDDYGALIGAGRVHVIEEGGEVVAAVVLVDEPDGLLLDNVAVSPRAQGRGHGQRLVAFAEQEARRRGHRTIRLYTNVLMTQNIALYERLGFVETHRGEEKGFRRVFMAKQL